MIINECLSSVIYKREHHVCIPKDRPVSSTWVDALPEDTVGPHDAIMASCGVSGQHFLIKSPL